MLNFQCPINSNFNAMWLLLLQEAKNMFNGIFVFCDFQTLCHWQKGVKSAENNLSLKNMVIWVRHMCFFQKDFIFTSHGQQQCKERVVLTNHTKHNSFPFFTISCIQQNCCLKNDTSRKRHAKNCLYFLLEIKILMKISSSTKICQKNKTKTWINKRGEK